jgi:alpha-beta hydrolase superfamily lysophospholipase
MSDLLVLSGPALAADVPAWKRVFAPVLGRIVPKLDLPMVIDGDVLSTDPSVGEAYENDPMVTSSTSAGLGRAMFEAMEWTTENLDRLAVPTYVIHGGDDTLVPPSASEPFEGHPRAERVVLPGLRHEPFNEPSGLQVVDDLAAWIDLEISQMKSSR